MNPQSRQYQGPDAEDQAVSAFRELPHAEQFREIQRIIKSKEWGFLRKLILRTKCVQEGLLCFWPRGFRLSLDVGERLGVRKRWKTGVQTMLAEFKRLSDQEKAGRILQAEELGEHDFLALLTLETDCVLQGFINDFPKLPVGRQKIASINCQKQRRQHLLIWILYLQH
jgi:hypothetical protein